MTRTVWCWCWASAVLLLPTAAVARHISESTPITVTATIEAVDKATRVVTLTAANGNRIEIKAPDEMEGFNSLKAGDRVSATYWQAVALSVRKPGAAAPSSEPMVTTARKDRTPGSETRKQQTFTATVSALDLKAPALTMKDPRGRLVTLAVRDAKQLQNLNVGDTVDVTYYESLLIKVARP